MKAQEKKAVAMTAAQTDECLVGAFKATDAIFAQDGLTADQFQDVATARGWIADEMEKRGKLHMIGVNADYTDAYTEG